MNHNNMTPNGNRRGNGRAPELVTLSVVIVNYKTCQLTLECIQSVYNHSMAYSYEVILLDNASDDLIKTETAEHFPGVRFIETGGNLGYSKANNLGIHNSRGKYVLLLNSDAKLINSSLEEMIRYMEGHSGIGILGPRHVNTKGLFQLSCGKFPTFFSEIARKLVYYRMSVDDYSVRDYLDGVYSNSGPVDWVSGSCLLVRRRVLEEIGLLDERFFMYFEDVDLCARARKRSWNVQFYRHSGVVHHGGASARKNLLMALIENRRSQVYFSRKYYGVLGEWVMRIILLIKYGWNAFRWLGHSAFEKIRQKGGAKSYTMALLAKKIILLALSRIPVTPLEPALQKQDQTKKASTHDVPSFINQQG